MRGIGSIHLFIERMETRRLLVNYGPDLGFGVAGLMQENELVGGGAKADLFNNVDGEVDTIDSGRGLDTAQADGSIDQLMNVEAVM